MESAFLYDLVIVFGLGLAVVFIFSKLRLPAIVGFLLTGICVGPYGFKLVNEPESVSLLAEVGIVVLLFTIGLEFSISELKRLGIALAAGGALQVALTTAAAAGIAVAFGQSFNSATLIGFIVALSSTAIVMRLLAERNEALTPQGRTSLGILIFQDLAIVPMMLAVPLLAGHDTGWQGISLTVAKAVGVIIVVLLAWRVIVPRLLRIIVKTRSRELFLLSIIVICLGTALLTSRFGLSLALGAFLAGLVISESEYSHHTIATIIPFRDTFSSLFFVSIGMMLDLSYVASHLVPVIGCTVLILAGKALIVTIVVLILGYHLRIAILTGILLMQIGEFSFLLMGEGQLSGLLTEPMYHLLIAAAITTMVVTPMVISVAPGLSRWVAEVIPLHARLSNEITSRKNHVIIVGFGVNGRNLARVLRHINIQYVILELNPETVRHSQKDGEPILYGDATCDQTLRQAGVEHARIMVVTIPDAASARKIIAIAKELNPAIHIIVRTPFVGEVDNLYRIGASEVVPEEFETSIELFSRVLRNYMVPRDVIDQSIRETRQEGYEMFRALRMGFRPIEKMHTMLPDVQLEVYGVAAANPLIGKTLAETNIKTQTGALILAIHRRDLTTPNPPADWRLEKGDVLLLFGRPEALCKAGRLFQTED